MRSAMPSVTELVVPDLVFCAPALDAYKQASRQIRLVFEHFTPIIEPLRP